MLCECDLMLLFLSTKLNAQLASDTADTIAAASDASCGVCLHLTSGPAPRAIVGGRQYHVACANMWLNRVDRMLPSLTV